MRLLATADTWFVDGNLSMAPRGFMQLYVIRVSLGTTAVSDVYALMERKSQQCYQKLVQAILDYCDTADLPAPTPLTVLCDFELAVIRALRAVLPPVAAIQGCFYHLTKQPGIKSRSSVSVCGTRMTTTRKCSVANSMALHSF